MNKKNVRSYLFRVCVIAALGGLLFGLDQGFINGSLDFIKKEFHWTTLQGETYASIMLYGCVFGAILSSWIARKIGRKRTLIFAAFVFTSCTLWGSLTHQVSILYGVRFLIGIAVGCASFCVPLYLSEIAPTKYRGGFIAMYQLMITIGIFAIYVSNSAIAEMFHSWRLMLGVIALPSLVMLIGVQWIPKTPRWLMLAGRQHQAQTVLATVRETQAEQQEEFSNIQATIAGKLQASLWDTVTKGFFVKVLLLGIFLQLLQQLSGINCVIYYSGTIFKQAGFANPAVGTIVIGLVNMLTTIVAVRYVDKWGRKPILYFGLAVMVITLVLIGVIFTVKDIGHTITPFEEILLLAGTIIYIIAFAVSLGPIIWVICAEIFPLAARDFGVMATTVTNWIGAALVVQFSMSIMDSWGGSTLFFLFAGFCLLGFILIGAFTPETKGVSLEALEQNLRQGKKLRHLGV